ncbi:hypothetical protein DL765_009222 [Monosporascus sp. GIB2]|nr:hypothetical protein DL765_009222 [Monosporascus sp. GIB2]
MFSTFIEGCHAASRTLGSWEYLERPAHPAEEFVKQLPADLVTQLLEAGELVRKCQETGVSDHLDIAIQILHRASSKVPNDNPQLGTVLSSCEAVMDMQFAGTGEFHSLKLDLAVEVAERSVLVTSQDHPCRAARLSSLSSWLGRRFTWHSYDTDIDRAVQTAELAALLSSADGSTQAGMRNNLGYWLGRRFDHAQDQKDLDRAVDESETAVGLTMAGDPLLAVRRNNLAVRRLRRFQETGLRSDITSAIEAADLAVKAPGVLEADRSRLLVNLASMYLARSAKARRPNRTDIDQANHLLEEAVREASRTGHPNYADWLLHFGECKKTRYDLPKGGEPKDFDGALQAFREGWDCPSARTETRVLLARKAASILAAKSNWPECSRLLAGAVELLHFVPLPSQSDMTRQQMLSKFQGLAAEAAAAALETGDVYQALSLLESGRSVTKGFMLDIDAFDSASHGEKTCPELWDYGPRRDSLDSFVGCLSFPATTTTRRLWESQVDKEQASYREVQSLFRKVRANPHSKDFLQLHSLDELVKEAREGPMVILNTTVYRCDAIIVETTGVSALRLEKVTLDEIKRRGRDLRLRSRIMTTLDWLWTYVAHPIIDRLRLDRAVSATDSPRVFWILPGAAGSLPMHAAGRHVSGSTETVIDRAMSSYCSSVKSLIYSRRKARVEFGGPEPDVALLISMAETAGLDDLPYAPVEVAKVESLFHSLGRAGLPLTHSPPGVHPIVQLLPLYSEIRDHFFECKIFHFAGHGLVDPLNPLASRLCLRDWEKKPLTVKDLMNDFRVYRHAPFLAYLSACSTGTIEDDRLIDEGLHLIGVFQQAGFRHVIGSLSPVSDQHCVDIAETVYATLRDEGITDKSVCRGLHRALRAHRDAVYASISRKPGSETERFRDGRITFEGDSEDLGAPEPVDKFYWVPYVHFGV